MMINKNIISFLGLSMHAWTMEETVETIRVRLKDNCFTQHVVVNVAKLVGMRKDSILANSVTSCDIINIDGMGVVWGARFLGNDVPERVSGIDLFYKLLKMSSQEGYPVFLLGAKEEVINKTVDNVIKLYPDLNIAGFHHGFFWDNEEEVVEEICRSGAKLLFVAISSPNKENFINQWKDQLGVSFVMGVGGTFDVVSGFVKRAPLWMQQLGLEWLYRVLQEPNRMWKRYLVSNTQFFILLLKEKLFK